VGREGVSWEREEGSLQLKQWLCRQARVVCTARLAFKGNKQLSDIKAVFNLLSASMPDCSLFLAKIYLFLKYFTSLISEVHFDFQVLNVIPVLAIDTAAENPWLLPLQI